MYHLNLCIPGDKIIVGLSSPISLESDDCSQLITNLNCPRAKCEVKQKPPQLEVKVSKCNGLQVEGKWWIISKYWLFTISGLRGQFH